MRPLPARPWSIALLLLAAAVAAAAAIAADRAPRVLVLHSFGPRFSPYAGFSAAFRSGLAQGMGGAIDVYEASLDMARFGSDGVDGPFADYLEALVAERPPDLVVGIGGVAARFVEENRDLLAPDAPVLVTASEEQRVDRGALRPGDAAITFAFDLRLVLGAMLAVAPETERVFVVIGASPLERYWRDRAARDFAARDDRIALEWASDLSYEDMLARIAALPPKSAVLYGMYIVDGSGVPHEEDFALADVIEASAAPVFGVFESQLGKGIIGGPLVPVDALTARAVAAARSMIAGEGPGPEAPPLGLAPPAYDSRALQRWGIPESRLPEGARVEFREATVWQEHRTAILGLAAVGLLQAGLIVALLLSRRRLRGSRAALERSEKRLTLAAGAAGVGLWEIGEDEPRNWLSASGRRLLGFGEGEPASVERFVAAAHPEDRPAVEQAIARAAEDAGFAAEYRLAASGERWVDSRGEVERDPAGRPRRIRGVSLDVTERKRAEQSARDLSARLIDAQEEERARLARELHDDVTQRLAWLAIEAGRVEAAGPGPEGAAAMRHIREELARLGEDVHALSYRLHPSILTDLGLADAIEAEVERVEATEGLRAAFEADDLPADLAPGTALCLFRIAQEALWNAARHAGATRIRVRLRRVGDRLCLLVEDDGRGFDADAPRARSLGLDSMRRRAELAGGTLGIESAPGRGVRVRAAVPIVPAPEEADA